MVTVTDTLTKAKALLMDRGWTQSAFARDKDGKPIMSKDETATCYCMLGAIQASCCQRWDGCYAVAAVAEVMSSEGGRLPDLAFFNDYPDRTLDEVIALIDKAIQAQSQKEF
jgi:hypothetical protein